MAEHSEGGFTMADDPKIESGDLQEEQIEVVPTQPGEKSDAQDLPETGASIGSDFCCSCCCCSSGV
jgi:hypothetical protein